MTRRSDAALVKSIKLRTDQLFNACQAAVDAGLDVTLSTDGEVQGDDDKKAPSVWASVSRRYEV